MKDLVLSSIPISEQPEPKKSDGYIILSISLTTVLKMMKTGELEAYQFEGRTIFLEAEFTESEMLESINPFNSPIL